MPRSLLVSLLALALGASLAPASFAEEGAPPTRRFRFEYRATVPAQASAKRLDVWVPLPLEDDLQSVSDLKVEAKCGDAVVPHEVTKDETFGNRMVHVGLDGCKGAVSVVWSAVISRTADHGQGKGPVHARFREADRLIPITGRAADMAKELDVGSKAPLRERMQKVYDHVLQRMTYDKQTPGYGLGDFDRACDVGKGNCTDFHSMFMGIARAGGVPVRFTMGVPLSTDPKGAPGGYHCWAHFHDGASWVPVDISEADKVEAKDPAKAKWFFGHLDPDRVALTIGRDVVLAPAQKGEPLLFFVYPYAEADGKAIELPKESRAFSFENA